MKKILLFLLISLSILSAEEPSAKVVYDLTTKDLANFELKILKAEKDVYSFVKIIPNSIIGLIDRQNEGYAYIPLGD